MTQSGMGCLIRFLRDQRGLSLRELGRLAEVDHAYIHRLETGDKESPSADVLAKLTKALKPAKRDIDMLHYLGAHPETPAGLVEEVVKDPTISFDVFAGAASMAFRGNRPNFQEIIRRVRRILEEDNANG
jgi:HTH-type transcriptional regulator, competence development regulator